MLNALVVKYVGWEHCLEISRQHSEIRLGLRIDAEESTEVLVIVHRVRLLLLAQVVQFFIAQLE